MKQEYSPYKIVHHQSHLNELKAGRQPNPIHLQIVPTNSCNHFCKMCCYRIPNSLSNQQFDKNDFLSYEKIVETLDSAIKLGIKSIEITGGGESLTHPKIYPILKEILNRNIDLALVTNGSLLNEKLCELLSHSKWVRISLDAGFHKTYSDFRKTSSDSYVSVLNKIKCLVKYRKNNIIGVGFVVNNNNYTEIFHAAAVCKDMGVDNFRISAAFNPKGYNYFKSFLTEVTALANKTKEELEDDGFTVFNLFDSRIKDMAKGVQNYKFCPIKELQVYLGADYNLYTCCTLSYNTKGLIGSIKNQSLYALWNSKEKKEKYAAHNPSIMCQHPCLYKDKNLFMNYCIEKYPIHANFI